MKGTPQITQRNPGRNQIEPVRTGLQTRPIPMHKQDCSGEPSAQIHLLPTKQGNERTYVITDSVLEYLDWEKPSNLPLEKLRWKLEKKARWLSP